LGVWHRNACSHASRAIIPYDQRLSRFAAYLQQLDMESNGKRVDKNGKALKSTGPIVWGEPGTNGQHAFFQLLHQGTDVIPVEFLIAAEPHEQGMSEHHTLLVSNCLAQSQALMKGRTLKEANAQLLAAGKTKTEAALLAPHKVFEGNRPSITLAYKKLDPFTLGRLIALYEHRVFVEGVIWGLNSFDQWGVELGKELATALQPVVEGKADTAGLDSSTVGQLSHLQGLRSA
jgi:glucose-6-phosphate isomerase